MYKKDRSQKDLRKREDVKEPFFQLKKKSFEVRKETERDKERETKKNWTKFFSYFLPEQKIFSWFRDFN